jgi:replicative DNA helicase
MKPTQTKKPVSNVKDLFANPQEENVSVNDIAYLSTYEEQAMEYLKNDGKYQGVSTGYRSIDSLMGSFLPGEIFTLGGDTGHGKSLLAMNIAQNVYKQTQQPVLFINLELTVEQAVQRFYNLAGESRDYAGIMVQTQLDINYTDIDHLMGRAKEEDVALVVVDHLHFFDDSIGDNAHAAITRIMKYFKRCAMKHELPVLLLSHVTPSKKQDGSTYRPDLHSFKGSKSIEQVSDMVGFVFRHEDNTRLVDFYMRKNRSRPLDPEEITLTQKSWKLEEDPQWQPKNLPPLGG